MIHLFTSEKVPCPIMGHWNINLKSPCACLTLGHVNLIFEFTNVIITFEIWYITFEIWNIMLLNAFLNLIWGFSIPYLIWLSNFLFESTNSFICCQGHVNLNYEISNVIYHLSNVLYHIWNLILSHLKFVLLIWYGAF